MLETDTAPAIAPTTVHLSDYQPPAFLIPELTLDIVLGPQETLVTATLHIVRNGTSNVPLVLQGEKMQLESLTLNGETLVESAYAVTDENLTIAVVPDSFELQVVTRLQPHLNTELSGLYQSSGNFCTQCEAEGFRRITYFADRPDVLSVYTVTLTADQQACPVLLSNGNLADTGTNSDGTHWARWHDPFPKPSYLFALVAGDLQHISEPFTTASGKPVELNIYTQAHNIDKCEHAMLSLKNAMRWDEDVYGREYDLSVYNIVAVDDFNMGAMENKGLNIFNSRYVLANQETATDADYDGIESVIAHEYFHNWSGNRVTCRDWFQLSLKEGFTVFRDQEFSADMGSRSVKRIRDVQMLRAFQFKEDSGPMAHPVRPTSYQEINNFYTVTIYQKGAEVIRMLHQLLGAQQFRKGTDLYFDKHDGEAVTTDDFVAAMAQANNVDLEQFQRWYTQSGTPIVSVSRRFDQGTLSLTLTQSCPPTPGQSDKDPFQIPIAMALFDTQGRKLTEDVLSLSPSTQTFEFPNLQNNPTVSLLRGFSAPIKLQFDQSEQELLALVQCEDDGFVRWESMQRLCLNVLLPSIKQGTLCDAPYQTLRQAFQALIESNPEDKAVLAEMLTLPSNAYITELCQPIEPLKIAAARHQCFSRLAQDLESFFHTLYAQNNQREQFALTADAMAERALKNRALFYLVETGQSAYLALASHQYHNANNMTDRLAAFTALVHSNYAERQALIDHFFDQWKHDPLVLDKWFAIQASAPVDDVFDRVQRLMENPAFALTNPNKVRSLIGAFTGNFIGFHQASGAGHEFLANQVLKLDQINPQIAARLVSALNNWRVFEEPYKSSMRSQLARVADSKKLSSDVTEIVNKALT